MPFNSRENKRKLKNGLMMGTNLTLKAIYYGTIPALILFGLLKEPRPEFVDAFLGKTTTSPATPPQYFQ